MTDTEPRFDKEVAYRIPTSLYLDIQAAVGIRTPSNIAVLLTAPYVWRTGLAWKRVLNLLHKCGGENCRYLESLLYIYISEPEPEAPELQEVK